MGGVFGKSGSFVLDHSMDNIPLSRMDDENLRHGSITTLSTKGFPTEAEEGPLSLYETKAERKSRRNSLYVAYVTMFVMSTGFSIVLTGVWPYMQTLNKDLGKEYVGWVVAANPFGQVIASPILGIWGNKAGSIRIPCMVTVTLYIIGNGMYSLLSALNDAGEMASYYGMIVSRFIVGFSAANIVLARSYIAGATTLKERTVAISIIAASQALGFVVGPVIQALLTAVVPDGVDTGISWLRWDKYTSCSWVAAAMGVVNLIILMPCIFKEHNISAKELAMMKLESENLVLPKPKVIGIVGIMFSNFLSLFIFTLIETLAEPFVQDEYGWSEDTSLIIVGIGLAIGGVWSVVMFSVSGYLCRKFDERKVLLCFGYPLLVLGAFLFLPWGNNSMAMKCQNETTTIIPSTTTFTPITTILSSSTTTVASTTTANQPSTTTLSNTLTSGLTTSTEALFYADECCHWIQGRPENCSEFGCPYDEQPWCEYTPQLPMPQLGIAFFIIMCGYPVCQTISQAVYSKMLGPKPQGIWMGFLTTVGGLSRILGPIFVTYVYTFYGTYLTFGVLTGCMALALFELALLYKKLVPMKIPNIRSVNGFDGPAAKDKY